MHTPQLPPIGPWRGLPPLFLDDGPPRKANPPNRPDPANGGGRPYWLTILIATAFIFLVSRCRGLHHH
jgi:hypothetical protein